MTKRKKTGVTLDDFTGDDIVDILPTNEIVRDALREYGKAVLTDRAIAHVCDGLKPVQRRIVWVLHEGKWTSKAMSVKSARVVGDTMGKYHPHGDTSIYDSLINLGWLRHPLVQRLGNYGSRTSLLDLGYAAQRYTETKLTEFGDRLFDDIHVIPKKLSFTEEQQEPKMLPVRVPLLLINGFSGIAVAISADIPPHNMNEVINTTLHLLENPDCDTADLLKFIKGPDYGMGRLLSGKKELLSLYEKGQGRLKYGCDYIIEEGLHGVKRLVITSLIPGIQRSKFLRETQKLADKKLLISPANDEGLLDTGCRIVVEFKDSKIVTDCLLPLLRTTTTHNFWALDLKGRPRRYSLKEMLQVFINFRRRVENRVLEDLEAEVEKKLGIEEAKSKAISSIDFIAEVLKTSPSVEEATANLAAGLGIAVWQAETLLGMPIRSLMRLNQDDILKRAAKLSEHLSVIQADLEDIDGVVRRRLEEMRKYSTKRGMSIRQKKTNGLSEEAEGVYYVSLINDKLSVSSELPLKSRANWGYCRGFVESSGQVLVVSRTNVVQILSTTYLDRYVESGMPIGLVSGDCKYCFVVTEKGKYAAFETSQKRTKYSIFKEIDEPIVWAVGADPDDTITICYTDGSIENIRVQESDKGWSRASKRPNVKPKILRKAGKVIEGMAVVRPGDEVFDHRWRRRAIAKLRTVGEESVSIVGDVNLVIRKDGKRLLLSRKETVDLGKQGEAQFVIALSENADA